MRTELSAIYKLLSHGEVPRAMCQLYLVINALDVVAVKGKDFDALKKGLETHLNIGNCRVVREKP